MTSPQPQQQPVAEMGSLASRYRRIRRQTERLVEPLAPEDTVVQSMADVSPSKWHLAHTSWFFERVVLSPNLPDYKEFHPQFHYLFNSYYETAGEMQARPERGLLSRPTLAEILSYRHHVDTHLLELLDKRGGDGELAFLIELGLNHEQQHQELILTDIKHVLSRNPLKPAYREMTFEQCAAPTAVSYLQIPSGTVETGAPDTGFCFDNETPRHEELLNGGGLASRLITNAEYREFIGDKGYQTPELWLSDGWAAVQQQQWAHPLYWSADLETEFTLHGEQPLDPNRPVCHVSLYEADAFARWADGRLPQEAEWETIAARQNVAGNLCNQKTDQPLHPASCSGSGMQQMFGDVWEWTASAYAPYPGFKPFQGMLGEYNGKFMCNQHVLRGGSCVTPTDHIRVSYRNFFYPESRWQFSGIRLARDEA
ncbi:MAG: ergothioneine biosynthesis protein EgtB [Gammaproteobacteria bacterium]|nr:ergothioneine biosynthesis protein EgtB [Gammaproteobacteria bacterium]MCZ6717313.1 ergothioneine biosynthesis protein EgtB [Gammaproteobacteria bacterium]